MYRGKLSPQRRIYLEMKYIQCLKLRGMLINLEDSIIRLLDYPCNDSTLIKWSEVNTVQLYVESYRGDPRPQISLSKRSHDYLYCDELKDKLNIVQDDVIQMLELKLEF